MATEKILLVEDDDSLRKLIEDILDKQGYTVVSAADVREGKDVYLKKNPDLVLTGYMLPHENGFDFMKWLQSRNSVTPVIMMTSNALQKVQEKAFRLGAAAFITKPFKPNDLTECISSTLE